MPKILDISYAGELGAANYILGIRDGKAVRFPVEVFEDEPVVNSSFTALTDTPADYVDQAGKLAAVNSTETGLEFIDAPTSLPAGGAAGQVLTKNSATEGDAGWEDAVSSFLGLSDTPASYAGNPGKVVAVKSDSSGLEFVSATAGSYTIVDLTSATEDYTLAPGEVAKITYTSATSVPLHIATVEGLYEVSITGSTTGYSSTGNAGLIPNTGSISTIKYRKHTIPMNNTATESIQQASSQSSMFIGAYLVNAAHFKVTTRTVNKTITGNAITSYSSEKDYAYDFFSVWEDTTTAWTSLGTITFPVAQSGTVTIRRII